jgi:hypothetical protein
VLFTCVITNFEDQGDNEPYVNKIDKETMWFYEEGYTLFLMADICSSTFACDWPWSLFSVSL